MAELAEKMDQAVKAMVDREGKYLTFSMANEEYGIGILKIKEIIGMMPITTVPQTPEFVNEYVMWGAGPRASQYLVLGAKARAVLQGRHYAGPEDIRAVAAPVLRHRIKTNFNADAEGITADNLIARLADSIPVLAEDGKGGTKVPKVFKASS